MIATDLDDKALRPFLKHIYDIRGYVRQDSVVVGFVSCSVVQIEITSVLTINIYEPTERTFYTLCDRINRAGKFLPKANIKSFPNKKIVISFPE